MRITLLLLLLLSSAAIWFRADLYSFVRPTFLADGGTDCLEALTSQGITHTPLGNTSSGSCGIKNAVRITSFPSTQLSSPITVGCPFALKLNGFLKEIEAKEIIHMGSYNCREMRGSSLLSEHSYGTAIDISHIDSASVQKDWAEKTDEGETLSRAHKAACYWFNNVLTPDTNAAHKDHLHLDSGFGLGCWL